MRASAGREEHHDIRATFIRFDEVCEHKLTLRRGKKLKKTEPSTYKGHLEAIDDRDETYRDVLMLAEIFEGFALVETEAVRWPHYEVLKVYL